MAWRIELSKLAERQLEKLDKPDRRRISDFIDIRLSGMTDPRMLGQALKGPRLGQFWRFRVGDYRLVCDVQDGRLVVIVLEIGHRSTIYRHPPR